MNPATERRDSSELNDERHQDLSDDNGNQSEKDQEAEKKRPTMIRSPEREKNSKRRKTTIKSIKLYGKNAAISELDYKKYSRRRIRLL